MIESHHVDQLNTSIGGYRLLRLIGRGEASEIYLSEQESDHTPVAIKKLYGRWVGDDLAKFCAQGLLLSRLHHPHILPILNFGVEDDAAYIIMQYAPNGTLRELHPKGSIVPPEIMIQYVKEIAAGLAYLHDNKLIHRDIKPHNMLLAADNSVMISDFGTAIISHSIDPLYLQLYDFEGTVIYAAPEQLQGRPRRSSDQYALGIVVYEWLCGEGPFSGSLDEMIHQHLFVSPPPLREKNPQLSPLIEQTVMKALAKDVDKRFPSVTAFAEALEWAVAESHRPAPQVEIRPRAKRQFMSPRLSFEENL